MYVCRCVHTCVRTLRPMRLRWSCSGSAAHLRKVHTSFATWLMVAGVPMATHTTTISTLANRNHRGIWVKTELQFLLDKTRTLW